MGNFLYLLISIFISEGVGALSAFLSSGNMEMVFDTLIKPSFAPPAWVFAPVWIILYALMGIAAYRIFKLGCNKKGVKSALLFYAIQLFLNFLWTIIFFRFELIGLAFIEIVILLIFIIITTVKFFKLDKCAGYLMVPYIIWVAFATVLNYYIWILNMPR